MNFDFLMYGFAVYAVTLIVTKSFIMKRPRLWFRVVMENLGWTAFLAFDVNEAPILDDPEAHQEITGYDFITCSMCAGVWVTAALLLWHQPFFDTLAAYGLSYWLVTQERE